MVATTRRVPRLPLRSRTVMTADGDAIRTDLVPCPHRSGETSLEDCEQCPDFAGVSAGASPGVVCRNAAVKQKVQVPIRLPSPAELTDLAEIMTTEVVCVASDLPVESAAAVLLERSMGALPVVDRGGRAIGFVSKTDVLRWYHDDADYPELAAADAGAPIDPELGIRSVRTTTAGEIMTSLAFTLAEDAPIAYAAALMAVEGIHHVVITTARGEVTGMVSSLDIVTWLAHHAGFLVPKHAAKD